MDAIVKDIYNEVKNRCMLPSNAYGIGAWDHHIELVYKIATRIYNEYHADYYIVALAALLHDIASVTNKDFTEEHHIIGAQIAGELLQNYDISKEKIEHIKKCILNHRGSRLIPKITGEEICVADADAMAHFYSVPSLLKMAYVDKNMSIDDGSDFIYNKLERSYNKLSDKGKAIITPQYEASKIILKRNF